MEFRAKVDRYFLIMFGGSLLIIVAVFLIPLFLDSERTSQDTAVVLSLCILTLGFLLSTAVSVKYVFKHDHLLVQGGLFRSRIPYEEITHIAPTKDIITGYRLLTSIDALEISYKSAILGSVKVSPQDKERFIAELEKRCGRSF